MSQLGNGRVVVLAGPSAVGKSTVVARLRDEVPRLFFSVSMTTRDPRPGEVDGESYQFVDRAHFMELVDRGLLLEHALVHGTHCYGTPRAPVEAALAAHRPVVLEIDLQGARQVKQNMSEARLVFLTPPSWEELVSRLRGRGTEDEATQQRRLATARLELAALEEADHVVENAVVEDTVATLIDLMGL